MNTGKVISLSLISHTNVGKTTLARTLLGRDIGVVRDEAHVTDSVEAHTLVETAQGDRLQLWDTPGFGDSARLARRLEASSEPIGWLVAQVWDRLRDRALWASQQAVRNVREQADVVLYLVNAAEPAGQTPYLDAEMRVLDWIGKPVVVLLNQMGAPDSAGEDTSELVQWRNRLAAVRSVRAVLALDAFARCWVQEATLLRTIAGLLPLDAASSWQRLFECWLQRRLAAFDDSTRVLTTALAAIAIDREPIAGTGLADRLRDVTRILIDRSEGDRDGRMISPARRRAMDALAGRLDQSMREATERLIRLHDLDGDARSRIFERLATHYRVDAGIAEGKAALVGSAVTGALAGLKADLATGGLSFGAGMLGGGLLGALGGFGIARGYNLVRGANSPAIRWSDEALEAAVAAAVLSYLAVAHYGRGRGDWAESEFPAHWHVLVRTALEYRRETLRHAWSLRDESGDYAFPSAFPSALQAVVGDVILDVLQQQYPAGVRDSGLLVTDSGAGPRVGADDPAASSV